MNRPVELCNAIQSVLKSKVIDEVVVTDKSDFPVIENEIVRMVFEMMKWEDKNVVYQRGSKHKHAAWGRYEGLQRASNEYALTLDDDGWLACDPVDFEKHIKDRPCIVVGCQDVMNVAGYPDWTDGKEEESTDFFRWVRIRKDEVDEWVAKWDLGFFRKYEKNFTHEAAYCAGTGIYRTKDLCDAYKETAEYFDSRMPYEDIYASLLVSENYDKWPLFVSKYFIYHCRMKSQVRKWKVGKAMPKLVEKMDVVNQKYEAFILDKYGVKL